MERGVGVPGRGGLKYLGEGVVVPGRGGLENLGEGVGVPGRGGLKYLESTCERWVGVSKWGWSTWKRGLEKLVGQSVGVDGGSETFMVKNPPILQRLRIQWHGCNKSTESTAA